MLTLPKKFPAITIGLLITVLTAIQSQVAANGSLSWHDLIPLLTGLLTHLFVSPAANPGL